MTAITMIAVGELKLADDNLRTRPGELDELAESIRSLGILEPLLVRTDDKVVVAGARRLMAAKKAGLTEVPAILRQFSEQERLEVMIVENLQREGLTPLEEADGFKRLTALGHSQKMIAKRVGCSQSHVAKRLSLLELPEQVQKQVGAGTLRLEAAQQLAKLKDAPEAVARIAAAATTQMRPNDEGDVMRASAEVTRKVEQELRLREQQRKIDAEVAKLEKKGERVIPLTADSYGGGVKTATRGTKIVLRQGWNDSDLVMVPATHAKLDCHAVGVHPTTLEVVEVCTDPSKHKTVGQKKVAQRKREEASREREEAQRAEAKKRREVFCEQLVRGKVGSDLLVDLLSYFALTVQGLGYDSIRFALGLLGVEPVEGVTLVSQIEAVAAKNKTERVRVLVAALVARGAYYGEREEWLRFLIELGYEPSEEEQKRLADSDDEAAFQAAAARSDEAALAAELAAGAEGYTAEEAAAAGLLPRDTETTEEFEARVVAEAEANRAFDEAAGVEVVPHPGMVIDGTAVIVPPGKDEADPTPA